MGPPRRTWRPQRCSPARAPRGPPGPGSPLRSRSSRRLRRPSWSRLSCRRSARPTSPAAASTQKESSCSRTTRNERASDMARPRLTISSSTRCSSVSKPTAREIAEVASSPRTTRSSSALPARDALVQPRVVDGHGGPLGQDDHQLLVAVGELLPAGLVGQVEVAIGLSAHRYGHPEESRHRRVARREPVRPRVLGHVRETQRLGVSDQLPQDAVAAREGADRAACLVVESDGEEALELRLALVEDAKRRVARGRQVACCLQHLVKNRLEVELGNQGPADGQQAGQLFLAERGAIRGQLLAFSWGRPITLDLSSTKSRKVRMPDTARLRCAETARTGSFSCDVHAERNRPGPHRPSARRARSRGRAECARGQRRSGRDLTLPRAHVVLRDGSTVCVRPVHADDEAELHAFLRGDVPRVSPPAVLLRCAGPPRGRSLGIERGGPARPRPRCHNRRSTLHSRPRGVRAHRRRSRRGGVRGCRLAARTRSRDHPHGPPCGCRARPRNLALHRGRPPGEPPHARGVPGGRLPRGDHPHARGPRSRVTWSRSATRATSCGSHAGWPAASPSSRCGRDGRARARAPPRRTPAPSSRPPTQASRRSSPRPA